MCLTYEAVNQGKEINSSSHQPFLTKPQLQQNDSVAHFETEWKIWHSLMNQILFLVLSVSILYCFEV